MGASSLAATGECYCTRLFQVEESLAELTPEERYTQRLELEKPVLDALLAWANETMPKTAPKSALGKALHYLLEQWPYLMRYLEDGRLELSNNRAERSIKPFVGLSQILCKHRNAVQIEQNLFKAEVAQAAAALFSK